MKPVEKKENSSGKNAYPGPLFNCAATLVLGKMFVFGGVQANDENQGTQCALLEAVGQAVVLRQCGEQLGGPTRQKQRHDGRAERTFHGVAVQRAAAGTGLQETSGGHDRPQKRSCLEDRRRVAGLHR